jgi:GAF domain-containing protein
VVENGDPPSGSEHGNSGHVDGQALEATISRLSTLTTDGVGLKEALELVVQSSHELFRLAGTGVMIFDDLDVLRYVAASDERARVLEEVQEHAAEGPCVDAAVYGTIVETADIASDERWPELARGMKGQGVGGVLGVPIRLSAATVGSLNVYAESRHAWDASERAAIRAFEEFAERLLQTAITAHQQGAIVEQLQYALDHRVAIERAVGMIMGRDHVEAPAAFERLRSAARRQRVRTAEIAERHLAGEALE